MLRRMIAAAAALALCTAPGAALAKEETQRVVIAAGGRPVCAEAARPCIEEKTGMSGFEILGAGGEPVGDAVRIATGQIVLCGEKVFEICVAGDLTGSGSTTLTDLQKAVTLMREGKRPQNVYEAAADVDQNGEVNMTDIVRLSQYFAASSQSQGSPVWHRGEYETVWVPESGTTRPEPVYAAKYAQICNHCYQDITGHETAHSREHMAAGEPGGFHLEKLYSQLGMQDGSEDHLQRQLICTTCGQNITESGEDPEEHRDRHARNGDRPGGFTDDPYEVKLVHVLAAPHLGGHYEAKCVSEGWWE